MHIIIIIIIIIIYLSNEVLLEECDKTENLEVTGDATTSW